MRALGIMVCIGVSTPPSKTPPPLSCQVPLNQQTVQPPPLLDNSPSILVFGEPLPPLKGRFFSEPLR